MERVTISLDDGLLEAFDAYIGRKGYANRSEAIRDLLRARLGADNVAENRATHAVVVAPLGFTPAARDLAASTGVVLLHHDDLPQIADHI